MNVQQILGNLHLLEQLVTQQPDELFDLAAFQRPAVCGTMFCTLGLAANHPYLQGQGLNWGSASFTEYPVVKVCGEDAVNAGDALDAMFGECAFDRLFDGGYASDDPDHDNGAKAVALARLRRQIQRYERLV